MGRSFCFVGVIACSAATAWGGPVFTNLTAERGVVAERYWPGGNSQSVPMLTHDLLPFAAAVEVTDGHLYGEASAAQTSWISQDSMYFSTTLFGGGGFGHATTGTASSFFDVWFEVSEPVESFHVFGMRGERFPFESWIRLTDLDSNSRLIDGWAEAGQYVFREASLVPGAHYQLELSSTCSGTTYWIDGWGQDVDTSWERDALTVQIVIPSGPSLLALGGGLVLAGGTRRR